ncbi:efflux RND transporter periplasmic adaptor subunit [Rhabdaerophilum calidifontis]|uniref:efflux RND transporter periplasmic adaptor subunit n=1 Tax=Rhabdaerophilum calidifontis TaxID=2604328 RepID=UPI00123C6B2C|nr:efflux RND transporter periplasmic adaptor subunit [Rhabdaerophilum calidifontis]
MSDPETTSPATAAAESAAAAPRGRRFLRRAAPIALLVLAGGGAAGWALASRPEVRPAASQAAADPTRPVLVRVAKRERLQQPRVLVGTIRARVEADQGFRVGGKLAERHVQVGDRVRAGTPLAVLDETDLRLARESAEAELAAARASARQAELERDRIAELRAKGWSTDQAADRQRAAVAEAMGRVARAERQVELAVNSQSYAVLKAEHDGIVIALSAEAGQVVAAGQAIIRLARDGAREVQVAVPEQDLAFARQARAEAALWSEPARPYPAALRELTPNADAATRTFQARFQLDGLPADSPLGMTATLTLAPSEAASAIRVPLSAILDQGNGPHVFVVDPASGVLALTPVTLLSFDAREAVIGAGLDEGARVVTLGVHTLRAGQKVRTLDDSRLG